MNKKFWLIGGIVFVFLLFVLGGFAAQKFLNKQTVATPTPTPDRIYSMTPDDIGLSTTYITHTKGSSSGPAIKIEVTKLGGVTSVDCELFYSHVSTDGSRITEDSICNSGDVNGSSINQEVVFGTCSDVCHFHTGIADVKIVLKVTKNDGKIYSVEKKLDPPGN